jgi:hypothetical protein
MNQCMHVFRLGLDRSIEQRTYISSNTLKSISNKYIFFLALNQIINQFRFKESEQPMPR